MTVRERLEYHMGKRNWSAYRLGKESGLSQSTVSHLFHNNRDPTISTLQTICRAFGITMAEFFADEEFVPLTKEQREMLDKWAQLNYDQKQLILGMMENMR